MVPEIAESFECCTLTNSVMSLPEKAIYGARFPRLVDEQFWNFDSCYPTLPPKTLFYEAY